MLQTTLLTDLKGVGPAQSQKFESLGIRSVHELIEYWPRRYDDYSLLTPISALKPGMVSIKAVIKQTKGRYVRRGMHLTEAVASDDSGSVRLIWFNQPYREKSIQTNKAYYLSAKYSLSHQRFCLINPSIELVSEIPLNVARIIPIYRETKGLNSRQIRAAVKQGLGILDQIPESLPKWLINDYQLMPLAQAIRAIHFPKDSKKLSLATKRLGFDEVFCLSLASLLNKSDNQDQLSLSIQFKQELARNFVSHLPFKLTDAQRRIIWQIYQDLQKNQPMNRLVEGDVGSGKTVVATMAALMAIEQGYQVALMTPTELLARQHANTIFNLLKPLGMAKVVDLLVGSMKPAAKAKARAAIAEAKAQFIIGTQALLDEKVDMRRLALVIIDEQHRFGVDQRKILIRKAGHMPHFLSLSATPIPRSLALTLYGELDISVLDSKPPGRKAVITEIVSPNSRQQLFKKIDQQLAAGRQMFVVCPLINESDKLTAASAEKVYNQLKTKDFKHRRVGLLHGKLLAIDKNETMRQFVNGEIDILVSTTVIEVGVDVQNATIMLIEGPERFGLAQIHQLRGRVGRGRDQGYCYLVMSDSSQPNGRLRALESNNDGFALAELDLELRGPGAIYGTMQHGQLDLRIAKLTDTKLIAEARQAADRFLEKKENLLNYEQLNNRVSSLRAVTNLN